jgi:hypothetical protein
MKIAGVKAIDDPPVGLVQHGGLLPHRPLARQGPVIELHLVGGGIAATLSQNGTAGGRKVLGAIEAYIVFARP